MAVDHAARKHDIIVKAIRLFARVGYKDVTFQMLASRTGVARTVLYRYFRDKRHVFAYAIVEATSRIAVRHVEILRSHASSSDRLRQLCREGVMTLFDNREFLGVIIDFVMERTREGYDMTRRVQHYTIGLRRMMHSLLVTGVKKGVFRKNLNPDLATDLLYALFESAVLRLAVTHDAVMRDVLAAFDSVLEGFSA